ncbi:helix-turn-helix transcriptional regulator [Clostridium sp. BNL1100]|uniref:helix-turn-helix domain-containing protein n=1 Tax=Clostridium sp. BNL1100 TaxID=755731 RepID=UPI00024A72B2|nr:helix-turn-helix transcriptional regulator [Clostridium sp. BNL1100]AEY66363.1 putative transcriptional regulator [Clostridium sp. BNL1100]
MSAFHERLKLLRDESGKTQAEIAAALGLTPQALSYYFNGREPGYDLLARLAKHFNVSTDYLLGISENRNNAEVIKTNGLFFKLFKMLDANEDMKENMFNIVKNMNSSIFSYAEKNYINNNFTDLLFLYNIALVNLINIKPNLKSAEESYAKLSLDSAFNFVQIVTRGTLSDTIASINSLINDMCNVLDADEKAERPIIKDDMSEEIINSYLNDIQSYNSDNPSKGDE